MVKFNSLQIYSDESYSSCKRFQAVGALSGNKETLGILKTELEGKLKEQGVSFIEYKKINGDKKREIVARIFIEKAIYECHLKDFRLDILYWDRQDSRHKVKNRDEIKNLEFMYYKLLFWVKKLYRNTSLQWEFYPDKNTAINWRELIRIISNTNLEKVEGNKRPLISIIKKISFPSIEKYGETATPDEPLSQLIDIFTGFGPFSRKYGEDYKRWLKEKGSKKTLFPGLGSDNSPDLSKGLESKFKVFDFLIKNCQRRKLKVSFKKNGYLCTYHHYNPNMRINYWFYAPQGDYDKAPIKGTQK